MRKKSANRNTKNKKNAPKKGIFQKQWLWIGGSVAAILIIAVVNFIAFFNTATDDHAVALVNGRNIYSRAVRGALSEETVRFAAINMFIEDYAEQLGIRVSAADVQWIEDDIDDFIAEFGQDEFYEYLLWNGFTNRADFVRSFEFQELMVNLIEEIMDNPAELARFEPYMPEDNLAEAEALAHELLARAHDGEDFDMLIATYGEDPGMAWNPDGYTFISGQMVIEFEQATRELEIGEISGLVRQGFGYHIIKRVEPNPDEMWDDELEWLGAKHILISMEQPSAQENLFNAIQSVFGAMADEAEIELLQQRKHIANLIASQATH